MEKPKRQPKNFFRYFVDEFIFFRRDFYFETTASPEMIMTVLIKLGYENNTWWWRQRRIIPLLKNFEGRLHFELIAEQPIKGGYDESAKATGAIYAQNHLTVLEGQITVASSGYYLFLLLLGIAVIYVLSGSPVEAPAFLVLFVILFPSFFWIQSYFDRNHLYKLIQSVVESSHESDKAKAS
jgi:hypothetical protein